MARKISEEHISSIVHQVINESLSDGFFDDTLNFSRYDYTLSVGLNLIDKFVEGLKSYNIKFKVGSEKMGVGNFIHFKSEKDYDCASKIYNGELRNTNKNNQGKIRPPLRMAYETGWKNFSKSLYLFINSTLKK